MKKSWYSFSVILFALFLSGCQPQERSQPSDQQQTESTSVQSEKRQEASPEEKTASWEFDGEQWKAMSSVPSCPEPLVMESLIDIALVSSVLYPGQYRGGDYKPHGGFRFDGKKPEDITVKAPLDARLTLGSRYIEQGEIQYLLWFENSCGIVYRFDHLLTLAPAMQKLVDNLPQALPDDSRTTRFATSVEVKAGDVIATAVGFAKSQNVGFDLGVYDLRQPNTASKNKSFAKKHEAYQEQTFYAVCWFDLLSSDIAQKIRSLPAVGIEGKTSDYCL